VVDHPERADPELLDQHDLIALGIERQHGHGMTALEHFAHQFAAHAAREQPVAQAVANDLEMTVVGEGLLEHHHPRIGHLGSRRPRLR
jgi:hypothetical protein